jgi:integrase
MAGNSQRLLLTRAAVEQAKPATKPYRMHDTKVPGLFLRVQPSGAKSWNVQWQRQTSTSLGRFPVLTLEQARERARKALVERDELGAPVKVLGSARVDQHATLAHYLEHRFEPWAKANLKAGARNVAVIRKQFPKLLDVRMCDLTTWHLENWRTERAETGALPASINRDLIRIKGALSRAVEWKVLPASPFAGVKVAKVDNTGVVRFLSAQEAKALRAALAQRDTDAREARARTRAWATARAYDPRPAIPAKGFADHLTPMVLLALNTGLRRGELVSLTWSDVSLAGRMLTVRGGYAKSGKARHIPLNAEALDVLKRWRKQSSEERIFPVLDPKKAWAAVLESAKVHDFRFHDLRHDFASQLVMRGVDLNTVRELLGHKDITMTLRYAHLAPEHKRAAVDVLGR